MAQNPLPRGGSKDASGGCPIIFNFPLHSSIAEAGLSVLLFHFCLMTLRPNMKPPIISHASPIYLKRRRERRLRGGHPWIFSNEIDVGRSPLNDFVLGQNVEVRDHGGKFLAHAYVNPHSLISLRIISRTPGEILSQELIVQRLQRALAWRERLFPGGFYRLVFGEGDGLPGLVVDRYGDIVVVQIGTAGMEAAREMMVSALDECLKPKGILLRNDSSSRSLEQLDSYIELAQGQVPETLLMEENGARFEISPHGGQKTGWFYDQRENRRYSLQFASGSRVLDLFSYSGGWGVQAAAAGAREVLCVDCSANALEQVTRNAQLSGVQERVQVRQGDAFDVLKSLRADGERFDLVIVDPPAFIRRKKDRTAGLTAYRRAHGLAMQLVSDGGILVAASCSYHLQREQLTELIARVAHGNRRNVQIFAEGRQAADHPVHPALPESSYLKAQFVHCSS